ncbi:MAG: hypothetical protein A4S16_05595 [Proteobacteria bacterium SG_bin6]|nr:MAG: hypothetical protein A4S16_05595 [Proteobacteria bacterium SG_bin6]
MRERGHRAAAARCGDIGIPDFEPVTGADQQRVRAQPAAGPGDRRQLQPAAGKERRRLEKTEIALCPPPPASLLQPLGQSTLIEQAQTRRVGIWPREQQPVGRSFARQLKKKRRQFDRSIGIDLA